MIFSVNDFSFADVDGDSLASIKITTQVHAGSLKLSGIELSANQVIARADIDAGKLSFTPVANENGVSYDNFGFKVNDGTVDSTATYTMTINVTAMNDAPVAADNMVTTNEDTNYIFTINDLSFTDIDGDSLVSIKITSLETVGSLKLNGADVTLNQEIAKADIDEGKLTFTPGANENGVSYDSFGFKVSDGTVYSTAFYTMTINVTAENDAPIVNDSMEISSGNETPILSAGSSLNYTENDAPTVIDSTVTVSDVDNIVLEGATISISNNYRSGQDVLGFVDTANITGTFNAITGILTLSGTDTLSAYQNALRSVTYQNIADNPNTTPRTISWLVNDGQSNSTVVTSTVNVIAVNDAPIAANNTIMINEDTDYIFKISDFNFTDIDSDSLVSVKVTTLETVGSLKLNGVDVELNQVITAVDIAANKLKFTPVTNANGIAYDSFSFKVNDGAIDSSAAYTMTINVTVVNDAPTAESKTVITNEDTDYIFSVNDFNFADIDGDSLASIKITTLGTAGTLKLDGIDVALNQVISKADIDEGKLIFVPVANANGASYDSFAFKVNDGMVDSASSYTMTINVAAVNDAPTAADSTVATNEDTDYTFTAADFNFADIDGDSLASVKITSLETVGSIKLNGVDVTLNQVVTAIDILANKLKFTPVADANGNAYDSFSFKVNDGTVDSVSNYTMTINVIPINDAPVNTVPGAQTVSEDTALAITGISVNDVDANLASMRLQVTNGTLTVTLSGAATISSGVNGSSNLTISGNQTDINATLASLSYRSNLNFSGSDTLTVTSMDSVSAPLFDEDTIAMAVAAVNDAPTAVNSTVTTNEDTDYTFSTNDFNFADIDGDSLVSIKITMLETVGSLKLNGVDVTLNQVIAATDILANKLKFTPVANANGNAYDSFSFKVNDGTVDSVSSYTMIINVTAVNDAPLATNKTVTTNEDTDYTFSTSDFNFADIDGDTLASIKITSLETVGSLKLDGVDVTLNQVIAATDILANKLKFTPVANANGNAYDSFSFKVNDGTVDSVSSYTMTINVTAVNDAPLATNKTVTTNEDTDYTLSTNDFNFADIDGDSLVSIKITTLETVGSLKLNGVDVTLNQVITAADIAANKLKFTPVANANGSSYDSFSFKVNDGTVDSVSAYTMTIHVTPVNDVPTAVNSRVTTNEDTDYTFSVNDFNFTDIDGDTLASIKITSLETVGSLKLDGVDVTLNQVITVADILANKLKFIPVANANGNAYDSFSFKVSDGTVDSITAYTMTINVTPMNDAPVISAGFNLSYIENAQATVIDNTIVLSDVDNSTLTSAKISIINNYRKGEDILAFVNTANIAGTFNASTGVLSLTGADTTAAYQNALRSVTYQNTSDNPNTAPRTVSWLVNDGDVNSTSVTSTISITAMNDAPVAANSTVSTGENSNYTFVASDFNFADIDGDSLVSIKITSLETTGSLKLDNVDVTLNQVITKADIDASKLTFIPGANGNGEPYDNFSFKVNDGTEDSVSSYAMVINVGAINDAPTALNSTVTTNEDTAYVFAASDFNFSDVDIGDSLASVKITSLVNAGSLRLDGIEVSVNQVITRSAIDAGKLTFIAIANENGTSYDSFNFKVNDGAVDSVSAYTMTINVTADNDAPTAANSTVTTNEDTDYTFSLNDFNFTDIDGNSNSLASIKITALETEGSLKLNGVDVTLNQVITAIDILANKLKFTPLANANGNAYDSFSFKVNDGTVDSVSSYAMTINVTAVNDAPTAANKTVITNEDTDYTFSVTDFNFADIDGDSLVSVKITSLESVGSLKLDGVDVSLNQVITAADIAANKLKFTSVANVNGSSYDSFSFKVNDGTVDSVSAYTMTIHVTPVNDIPTAVNNTVTTNEDTDYTFTASDFNFADIDGDTLASIRITSLETVGALKFNDIDVTLNQVITAADILANKLKFTPVANANGSSYDSFSFKVNDGTVDSVSSYMMTMNVTAANDSAIMTAGATLSYTENEVAKVIDNTITINDIDDTHIESATVTISNNYVNAQDVLSFTDTANITASFNTSTGVLTLIGRDTLSAYQSALRSVKYHNTSDAPNTLARTISWVVNDGDNNSSVATSTISITVVNDIPTAVNSIVMTNEDTDYTFTVRDFNFADIDGDTLASIKIISLETVGSLKLDGVDVTLNQVITAADIAANKLKFTPVANANGSSYDSFSFKVNDGTMDSVAAYTMTINVTAVNDAPTAVNSSVTTNEDTDYTLSASDFNFADIDGNSLVSVKITALETVGSLKLDGVDVTLNQVITAADIAANKLKFTPVANANGSSYDSFSFKVNDGTVDSVSAYTMTIHVTPVNDVPTAVNSSVTTNEDTDYTFSTNDFNFADIDGDSLVSIKITMLETVGSLKLNGVDVTLNQVITAADIAANKLKFTPVANANGSSYDSFSFKVNDGVLESVSSYTMTIHVTPVNDVPTAVNSSVTTNEDTDYTFSTSDFNFADIDGDSLVSVKITSLESVGSLKLDGVDVTLNQVITAADIAANKLKFTPVANANGSSYDSFSFKVNDGTVDSVSAYTMTIHVTPVNDVPTAVNSRVTTNEDTDYTFSVNDFNFTDIDGDTLASIKITSLETVGSLKLDGVDVTLNQVITVADILANKLKFIPVANANGSSYDSFSFKVNDGVLESVSSYTMTINVAEVNDVPVISAGSSLNYTENGVAMVIDSTIIINEVDSTHIKSAFVSISANYMGNQDVLAFSNTANINGSFNPATGVLSLIGVDTVANYQAALRSVTYENTSDHPNTAPRTISWIVNDGDAYSVASTSTIGITAVNDVPTAVNSTVITNEDTDYTFVVSDFKFADIDGDSLASVKITSLESVGSLKLNGVDVTLNQVITAADIAANKLKFIPVANTNGNAYDSFSFKVNDGMVDSVTAYAMTINVTAVNDAPNATNKTVTINEDTNYTFVINDFNFTDVDGDGLDSIKITNLLGAGNLKLAGVGVSLNQIVTFADINAGLLTFTPVPNANGSNYANFGFKVNDGTVDSVGSYTMTINVTPVNDTPTAMSSTVVMNEDTMYTFTANNFNFADIDGDSLVSVKITSLESIGSLKLDGVDVTLNQVITMADIAANKLKFTPVANANGLAYDSFSFKVNDGALDSVTAYTMTIKIIAINDAPVISAISTLDYTENEGARVIDNTISLSDVDDTLLESATISIITNYQSGEDVLGFVDAANIKGVFNATTGVLKLTGIGTVEAYEAALRNVTYKNTSDNPNLSPRTVSWLVNDSEINSTVVNSVINITQSNDAPMAANSTVSTAENVNYVFKVSDFNFSDIENDSLHHITITNLASLGSLQLNGVAMMITGQEVTKAEIETGKLIFIPATSGSGVAYDNFGFKVSDGMVDSVNSYTMTINVGAINDVPTAINSMITLNEDTTYVFAASDFNFSDLDVGDRLASIKITNLVNTGSLKLNGIGVGLNQVVTRVDIDAGKLTFTPIANEQGVSYDSFGFKVRDDFSAESVDSYTMTIKVEPINDAPTAENNTVTINEDTIYTFTINDFKFSDIDGDSLNRITITNPVSLGSLQLNNASVTLNQQISVADINLGKLIFIPVANANGVNYASFSFSVNDGQLDSMSSYAMRINVKPINDVSVLSVASSLNYTENEGARPIDSAISLNDVDDSMLESATVSIALNYNANQDILSFVDTAKIKGAFNAATGVLKLTGEDTVAAYQAALRSITYENTSDNPSIAVRTVSWIVNDGELNSNVANSTINIIPINDAPIAVNNTVTLDEDTIYTFALSDFNFSDIENDSLHHISITNLATAGLLQLDGIEITSINQAVTKAEIEAGKLTFTPAANGNGLVYASFGFSVNDSQLDSIASYTMQINVSEKSDAPTAVNSMVTAWEDTDYIFAASDFHFNDVDGDELASIKITSLENVGVLQLDGVDVSVNQVVTRSEIDAGKLIFTPVANTNGNSYDSFGFKVNDGVLDSVSSYTMMINVTSMDDAPILTAASGLSYTENDVATVIDNTITIKDVDDVNLESATIRISSNYVEGEDILSFTNTESISGIFDVATGVLILSGSDTLAAYQSALRSVSYQNTSDNPSTLARTISWQINDGELNSQVVTSMVTITQVPDAPTATDSRVRIDEDTTYVFTARDFNFADGDGDSLESIMITTLETAGSLKLNHVDVTLNQVITKTDIDLGRLTFTPVVNANGLAYDSFDFSVHAAELDSVTSYTMTMNVTPVNDTPQGTITILGNPVEGVTLSVAANLSDVDGLGVFHYQWYQDNSPITGAINNSYTLIATDAFTAVHVTISYVDGGGTFEILPSGSLFITSLVVPSEQDPDSGTNTPPADVVSPSDSTIGEDTIVDANADNRLLLLESTKDNKPSTETVLISKVKNVAVSEKQVSNIITITPIDAADINPITVIVDSEFKRALNARASLEHLVDIAVNLVKQSLIEKSDISLLSKGILHEAIEARESPQVVAKIATGMLNVATNMGESAQIMLKGMIGQIVESNVGIKQIAEILAEIVLEVRVDNQQEVISNIVKEDIISNEQLDEIYRYLLQRDQKTADVFLVETHQVRGQVTKLPLESIKEIDQSGVELGLLSRLKAKLLRTPQQMETQETYSELDHRYEVMLARSNIVKRFLA